MTAFILAFAIFTNIVDFFMFSLWKNLDSIISITSIDLFEKLLLF